MSTDKRAAFTLMEILVCMAIVMALAGISASVYFRATDRSRVDVEISQMHQIGLAANLYHEQYDAWPPSTKELVAIALIPKEICFSPRDRYPNGFTNAWLTEDGKDYSSRTSLDRRTNYPRSYFCVGDMVGTHLDTFQKALDTQSNVGLCVSYSDSQLRGPNAPVNGDYVGMYRRVLLDGSVVIRHHLESWRGLDRFGKPIKFGDSLSIFYDPSEEWIKELARTIY